MTFWSGVIAAIAVSSDRHLWNAEEPANGLYCLGIPVPLRVPRPAASSTAPHRTGAALLGTKPTLELASYAHKVALIALQHLCHDWFWLNCKQ